jgi:hypothetical protein
VKLLTEKITHAELLDMAQRTFGNLVKGVVDIQRKVLVVDAELHADQESFLLENGSSQQNLWGINLYPEFPKTDESFLEFDSMINLRPIDGNKSRYVESPEVRKLIVEVVMDWVL